MATNKCGSCGTFYEGTESTTCSVCGKSASQTVAEHKSTDTNILSELRLQNRQLRTIKNLMWSFWIVLVVIPISVGLIVVATN